MNKISSQSQEPESNIQITTINDNCQLIEQPQNIFIRQKEEQGIEEKKIVFQTIISQKNHIYECRKTNQKQKNQISICLNESNNNKSLIIRGFIDTFINNLKRWSYIRQEPSSQQQKRLLEEQYLIAKETDQINTYPDDLQQQQIQQVQINRNKFITIPVFEHSALSMCLWKAFRVIIQLLILGFIPFLLSFQIGSYDSTKDIEWIFFLFLISDVFIQLNQSFTMRGQIVIQRRKILEHYVQLYLFKDIFELGSLLMIFIFSDQPWIILFVFIYVYLSIEKIILTLSNIQEYIPLQGTMHETISLTWLVIVLLLTSHTIACFWQFVGQQSIKSGQNSWILEKNLGEASNLTLYNYALYWATATMSTVGYGDITGQNGTEIFVVTCTIYITCGVYAFAFSSIANSISNIREQKVKAKQVFSLINQYMTQHQVSCELKSRVKTYLKFSLKQDQDVYYEDVEYIVDKLPLKIRQDLIKQIKMKALKKCKLINQNFSQELQNQLLPHMERLRFSPEEVILKQNQQDDCSIYIIEKGELELICNGRVLQKLQKGDSFGERSFLTGWIRYCTVTVQAIDFIQVYKLSQESVLKILYNHPIDKEKWCKIRDQIMLYEKYDEAKMFCFSCGQNNHLVTACPALFYIPDIERIIKKGQFTKNQDRSKFQRQRYKISSLSTHKQLNILTLQFQNTVIQDDSIEMKDNYGQQNQNKQYLKQGHQIQNRLRNEEIISSNLLYSVRENDRQQKVLIPFSSLQKIKPYYGNHSIGSNINIDEICNSGFDQSVDLYSIECTDYDLMHNFNHYFPNNNCEHVIKQYNTFLRMKDKISETRYSLYYSVNKRAQRIRRLIDIQQT